MIAALVAAAGKGERLRKSGVDLPKALMPHPIDGTFVDHLVRVFLHEVDEVFITLPDIGAEGIRERFAKQKRVRCIDNLYMSRGLIGSVQSVCENAFALEALLFAPTDLPLLRENDVSALKGAITKHQSACLRYKGENGHPAAIARSLFGRLNHAQTLKVFFDNTHGVETTNALCLENINDAEALKSVSARLQS